ncbi:MAG: glycosyltransferase family 2 protein [Bacteroidales bacterium]|nr:glycosyltransferase family 2 protein [Bacteroidales bacterium]
MENLFTIALPVYKRTDYIRKALDSAVNQTVKCRILLIDNNSPHDDFKTIVESYNNPLMKYVKTSETVPQDENFNNCIRYCETPWLTILHDDDILHCQYVEMAQKVLAKWGDKIGGFAIRCNVSDQEWDGISQVKELTDDIRVVKESYFYFSQLSPFVGVTIKKDIALDLNGFNASLHPIADFDFWYRISTKAPMLYVMQELAYYRISPNQSTNHLIDAMINNVYKYRLGLIEKGRHNNFLSRLSLEASRINNINFFKRTYRNVSIPDEFFNHKQYQKAQKLLKIRFFHRLAWWNIRRLSFDTTNIL